MNWRWWQWRWADWWGSWGHTRCLRQTHESSSQQKSNKFKITDTVKFTFFITVVDKFTKSSRSLEMLNDQAWNRDGKNKLLNSKKTQGTWKTFYSLSMKTSTQISNSGNGPGFLELFFFKPPNNHKFPLWTRTTDGQSWTLSSVWICSSLGDP